MMKKLIQQGPHSYGLRWYRVYQIQEHTTFAMVTDSIGEPDEDPLRIWWGQIYREEECMVEFQETLKRNIRLSPYVNWISEGGGEFMRFHSRDFDIIFELITESLTEYEG
jgi:hypothetical protein